MQLVSNRSNEVIPPSDFAFLDGGKYCAVEYACKDNAYHDGAKTSSKGAVI